MPLWIPVRLGLWTSDDILITNFLNTIFFSINIYCQNISLGYILENISLGDKKKVVGIYIVATCE